MRTVYYYLASYTGNNQNNGFSTGDYSWSSTEKVRTSDDLRELKLSISRHSNMRNIVLMNICILDERLEDVYSVLNSDTGEYVVLGSDKINPMFSEYNRKTYTGSLQNANQLIYELNSLNADLNLELKILN